MTAGTGAVADLVVDGRLLRSSGIGTYLQNLLPRLIAGGAADRFTVLGDREALEFDWLQHPAVVLRRCWPRGVIALLPAKGWTRIQ